MTVRIILLKIHLWLGLTAALFLVILGLTGSVMAFEEDIIHWTHPFGPETGIDQFFSCGQFTYTSALSL